MISWNELNETLGNSESDRFKGEAIRIAKNSKELFLTLAKYADNPNVKNAASQYAKEMSNEIKNLNKLR